MLKSIAVMTSGGDSPGMNACARAVVRTALYEGVEVWGINNGYHGLLDEDMYQMQRKDVGDIIQRGGTFLGTARCKRWEKPEGRMLGYKNLVDRGIQGLVVIGGDGSLRGASLLSKETGIPIVGLPGTIDNDVWGTDYTIGCDTAANTIIDAINKLRDTASAHRRCIVLEVMGHRCGWLAMTAGIAGGAEYILVPEEEYDLEGMCKDMEEAYKKGKRYILVVVAEGAGSAKDIGTYAPALRRTSARTSPSIRTSTRAIPSSATSSAAVRRPSSTASRPASSASRQPSRSSAASPTSSSASTRATLSRSTSTTPSTTRRSSTPSTHISRECCSEAHPSKNQLPVSHRAGGFFIPVLPWAFPI